MKTLLTLKEAQGENRVALTPSIAAKLVSLGIEPQIQAGAGLRAGFTDEDYKSQGAKIIDNVDEALANADITVSVLKPDESLLAKHKKGSLQISFLDPFNESDLLKKLAENQINAMSFEMVPRSTLAQKMDAISSQMNLAGYEAVIKAASKQKNAMPMMMTPSGTISPLKVFIVGVGVAGLQAIATAKRLGARVEAFDTRPVVEEQVKSLGAKFVKIDLGKMEQTAQGYAVALTDEQIEKQRQGMAKVCASSDIIITTAKLFGRKAPVIITQEMVDGMKNGSVIVDLAVESGGNVAGSKPDETVITPNGVEIIGICKMEGEVAGSSSLMYSSNVYNFIEHFWNKEENIFNYNLEDEILKSSLITYNGEIINERFK